MNFRTLPCASLIDLISRVQVLQYFSFYKVTGFNFFSCPRQICNTRTHGTFICDSAAILLSRGPINSLRETRQHRNMYKCAFRGKTGSIQKGSQRTKKQQQAAGYVLWKCVTNVVVVRFRINLFICFNYQYGLVL